MFLCKNIVYLKEKNMNIIGNVLTNDECKEIDATIKRCVNINTVDTSLPLLIIGYDNAKKIIKDFTILKKWYPEQNIYWTFSKKERKYEYDEDIEIFFKICISNICANIDYKYINIIKYNYKGLKKIISFLKNNLTKIVYIHNERFIFIYNIKENTVYGISLDICEYIGLNKTKIINILKTNPHNIIFDNYNFLSFKIRKFINENFHYIPLFYYKLIFI